MYLIPFVCLSVCFGVTFTYYGLDEMNSKWQQQQVQRLMERGSYSPSSSPCGMDLYECHLG